LSAAAHFSGSYTPILNIHQRHVGSRRISEGNPRSWCSPVTGLSFSPNAYFQWPSRRVATTAGSFIDCFDTLEDLDIRLQAHSPWRRPLLAVRSIPSCILAAHVRFEGSDGADQDRFVGK